MGRPQYVHVIDTGKVRITRESHPSWRGKHNSTKAKILLQLYSVWSRGDHDGLCLSELVTLTGTSPLSLQTLLPRWTQWAYTQRSAKIHNNKEAGSFARFEYQNQNANNLSLRFNYHEYKIKQKERQANGYLRSSHGLYTRVSTV